jgi:hypothetical protein
MSEQAITVKEQGVVHVNAEALIAQAIDKGLPIDTMERLLAMRRELKVESARESFFAALSEFQSEIPEIPKKKKVYDRNGKLRYSYAPLDVIIQHVKDHLRTHGFSYTIKTEQEEGSITVFCHLHHLGGHTETTSLTVPIDKDGYMNAPQKVASALTYAKRYAFCDATGIMTSDEDDDAQGAAETEPKQPPRKQESMQPPKQDNSKIIEALGEVADALDMSDDDRKKHEAYVYKYKTNREALSAYLERLKVKRDDMKLDAVADKAFVDDDLMDEAQQEIF